MSESPEKRQRGIENLLAERKKYESWIAQLDARRATTAEHVFVRVHADYATRLDDVRTRLANEADGVRSLVGDLDKRLATEQRLVADKTDERAEAELRASVGEFSDKEWASAKAKLDGSIDDLRAKFDRTERELADLKGVLQSIASAPAPRTSGVSTPLPAFEQLEAAAEPASPAKRHQPIADSAPTAPELVPPRTPMTPPRPSAPQPRVSTSMPRPPAAPTPFDELAFLKSVAGTPITPSAVVRAAPRDEPVAQKPVAPEPVRALPFMEEPVAEAPFESEPVFGEPIADDPPAAPRGRPSSKTPVDEPDEPGPLGAPTPRTSQAIRSLKCQECGTLNFPTEWYCERCGGELAAF